MAVTIPESMLPKTSNGFAKPTDSRTRLAENFENFLTLLTTQLKNQDPLSPMDGNQFTQQLVQMTGVEQQLQTNDLLKKLVDQGTTAPVTFPGGVELIGKAVSADKPGSPLTATGASWEYELPSTAKTAKIQVLNAAGEVVHEADAPKLESGRHTFTWDGKLKDGTAAKLGTYVLKISASSAGGGTIKASVGVAGIVTGSELIDGETWLTLGKIKVPLGAVTSVSQPA
jgi:flagellar basal-body rod modification protein FlgD